MKTILATLAGTALALTAGAAHAAEFKSVGAAPAVIYDAPSERGQKVFVAPRGMPLEVILVYGEWTKARDAAGDLFWIPSKALGAKRTVVVSAASAKVRAGADDASPLVFTADRNVLLDLAEPAASGWIKVRHHDGQTGYVKSSDVWGE